MPKNAFSSFYESSARLTSGFGDMSLMLRSTELNTFVMTTTIYRGLLCLATEGYLSIEGVKLCGC